MERIKNETGFTGDLKTFFTYLKSDKKFTPYKTPKEILDAFEAISTACPSSVKWKETDLDDVTVEQS